MTRRPQDTRPVRRSGGDPYGVGRAAPFLAPLLSMAGLLVIAVVTLFALTGRVPFLGSPTAIGGGGNVPPGQTPSPSAPPDVNPAIQVQGSLVYVKAGNLWIQSGNAARQLTNSGRDSQPTWSPDGSWVYFIETRETGGNFPAQGILKRYDLKYPVLTRIHPDGSGREAVLSGLYKTGPGGAYTWFWSILDPAVSPDGTRLAVVSDGPDPTKGDVVLQFVDLKTKRLVSAKLPENAPLGHQDPAWHPDGTSILYVKNARSGRARHLALQRDDEGDHPVHLGRVRGARMVAGRPVRGRRADDLVRHGRRDPRCERRGSVAGDHGWSVLGAHLVAGRPAARVPLAFRRHRGPPACHAPASGER